MNGASGTILGQVTSYLAAEYDAVKNAVERGEQAPVLYRAVRETPESAPGLAPGAIQIHRAPGWLGLAVVGIVFVAALLALR